MTEVNQFHAFLSAAEDAAITACADRAINNAPDSVKDDSHICDAATAAAFDAAGVMAVSTLRKAIASLHLIDKDALTLALTDDAAAIAVLVTLNNITA